MEYSGIFDSPGKVNGMVNPAARIDRNQTLNAINLGLPKSILASSSASGHLSEDSLDAFLLPDDLKDLNVDSMTPLLDDYEMNYLTDSMDSDMRSIFDTPTLPLDMFPMSPSSVGLQNEDIDATMKDLLAKDDTFSPLGLGLHSSGYNSTLNDSGIFGVNSFSGQLQRHASSPNMNMGTIGGDGQEPSFIEAKGIASSPAVTFNSDGQELLDSLLNNTSSVANSEHQPTDIKGEEKVLVATTISPTKSAEEMACFACDRVYKRLSDLSRHVTVVHPSELPLICQVCKSNDSDSPNDAAITFKTLVALNHHHLKLHPTPAEAEALKAKKLAKSEARKAAKKAKAELAKMKEKEEQEALAAANNKVAADGVAVVVKLENEVPSPAPAASKPAKRRKEQSERSVTCEECLRRFDTPSRLKAHQRIHSPDRPYECAQCQRAFFYPSKLACHQKVHLKEAAKAKEAARLQAATNEHRIRFGLPQLPQPQPPSSEMIIEEEVVMMSLEEHLNSGGSGTLQLAQ